MEQLLSQSCASSPSVGDYWSLLKPRVMSLVVFTGGCGLLMAPGKIHPFIGFLSIFCIAVAAGASGCLNMWYEREIDALMERTKNRALPQGRICPEDALGFGVVLSVGSVLLMGVAVNWIAAAYLSLTIGFYVFIYTIWLKPRSPQNIVIGGASGAFPPLIGWACVMGETPLEAWLLFAIIFFWTPPHFWALALHRHDDYKVAAIPMLPVVCGAQATKRQILLYSVVLIVTSLVPWWIDMVSWGYGLVATLLGLIFLFLAARLYHTGSSKSAMRLFGFSIVYLFLLFLMLTVDRIFL